MRCRQKWIECVCVSDVVKNIMYTIFINYITGIELRWPDFFMKKKELLLNLNELECVWARAWARVACMQFAGFCVCVKRSNCNVLYSCNVIHMQQTLKSTINFNNFSRAPLKGRGLMSDRCSINYGLTFFLTVTSTETVITMTYTIQTHTVGTLCTIFFITIVCGGRKKIKKSRVSCDFEKLKFKVPDQFPNELCAMWFIFLFILTWTFQFFAQLVWALKAISRAVA